MSKAKNGDSVKVHYTGTLEDGTIFDSSKNRQPLDFRIGSGDLIPGFESGVVGMEIGDSKTITIPPEDAYGLHREELVGRIPRSNVPENIELEIGQQLQVTQPDGNCLNVIVSGFDETAVTLDANHPLAGKTLIFKLELVEIA
ncbi:MAG TPA: peptidylprolyl isomerase [Desulfobacterales bacterium]|nr:peptidylprolyl isomerase [Desulfobacterales bacterium]